MKDALLDSDTVSFHLKGYPNTVRQIEAQYAQFGYLNISVVTYYEIKHGLLFKDAKKQMKAFETLMQDCRVLHLNTEIADLAAILFAELRRKNQVVSHTDVLIAATALFHDMKVVTNNQNHFKRIPSLELDNWV